MWSGEHCSLIHGNAHFGLLRAIHMPFMHLQVLVQQNGCWAAEASSAGCHNIHSAAQDTRLPGTLGTRAPQHMPGRTATGLIFHETFHATTTSKASALQVLSILDDTSTAALLKVLRQAAVAGSQSGPRVKKGKKPMGKGGGKAKAQRQQSPDVAAEEVQWEAGSQDQAEGSSQGDGTAAEQLTPEVCQALMQVRSLPGLQHARWLQADCDAGVKPGGDGPSGPSCRSLPGSLHSPCLFCFKPLQSCYAKRGDCPGSLAEARQTEAGR